MKLRVEEQYDFVIASGLTEYFDDILPVICKLASYVKQWSPCGTDSDQFSLKGQHKFLMKQSNSLIIDCHLMSLMHCGKCGFEEGLRRFCHSPPYVTVLPALHKLSNVLLSRFASRGWSARTTAGTSECTERIDHERWGLFFYYHDISRSIHPKWDTDFY